MTAQNKLSPCRPGIWLDTQPHGQKRLYQGTRDPTTKKKMNPYSLYRVEEDKGVAYCAAPGDEGRLDSMPAEVVEIIAHNLDFATLVCLLDGPRCLRAAAIDEIPRRLLQAGYDHQLVQQWPAEPHAVARVWVAESMRRQRYDPPNLPRPVRYAMSRIWSEAPAGRDPAATQATANVRAAIITLREGRRPDPASCALPVSDATWEAITHPRVPSAVNTFLKHANALAEGDIGPLTIQNLPPDQRRALHLLADDLGFEHETFGRRPVRRHARKVPPAFRRRFDNDQYGYSDCERNGYYNCDDMSACSEFYKGGHRGWEWCSYDSHSWRHDDMGEMDFRYPGVPLKSKATVIVGTRGTIRVPPLAPPPL